MTRVFESTDKVECLNLRNLGSKLRGYPLSGVHAGRGRHVDLGAAPDVAAGETKPGWTSFDVGVEPVYDTPPVDPDNPGAPDRYRIDAAAYEAQAVVEDALPARDKKLQAAERAALDVLLKSGKVIDRVVQAKVVEIDP